jgi:hypothetical protein
MSETSPGGSSMALVHEGWDHLKAGRPLAARASWQRALRLDGGSPAAAQALATLESAADLPAAARSVYRLRPPSDSARRAAWDRRLRGLTGAGAGDDEGRGGSGDADLAAMADAFGLLATEGPPDPAAWFNRALCLAWLGSNREAVASLDHAVALEATSVPDRAVEAWTLAELLRQGGGAEDLADDVRFSCTIDWDPAETAAWLAEFPEIRRLPTPQAPGTEPGPAFQVEIFEWPDQQIPESGEARPDRLAPATELPIVLATAFVDRSSRMLRLSSPRVDTLQQAEERLLSRIGADAVPRPIGGDHGNGARATSIRREAAPLPLPFLDADVWTVRIPGGQDPSRAEDLRREWVEHYYEDIWIHRPRQGLGGLSPLSAAGASNRGNAVIRARLAAIVDFREQLASRPSAQRLYQGYPFDRLRRRLGLEPAEPAAVDPADLSCAAPRELAALDPSALDDHRLAEAVASAAGLRDDSITSPLATELLRRPVPIAGVHLVGAVSPLVRRAMGAGDPDSALGWIERARPLADAHTAELLDLWRAEILARADRPEEALVAFRALIRPDGAGAPIALDAAETQIDNRHFDQARPLLYAARDLSRSNGRPWTARRAQELLDGLS